MERNSKEKAFTLSTKEKMSGEKLKVLNNELLIWRGVLGIKFKGVGKNFELGINNGRYNRSTKLHKSVTNGVLASDVCSKN